jgi:acyl carrier protein
MERAEILSRMSAVFSELLDHPVVLGEKTVAGDVEGWDSLAHIQLVVAVEKHFKVRFTSKEIQRWADVSEMVDSVAAKAT